MENANPKIPNREIDDKAASSRIFIILAAIIISIYALWPEKSVDIFVKGRPTAALTVPSDFAGTEGKKVILKVLGSGNVGETEGLQCQILDEKGEVLQDKINIGKGYTVEESIEVNNELPKMNFSAGKVNAGDTFEVTLNVKYINLGLDLVGGSELIYEASDNVLKAAAPEGDEKSESLSDEENTVAQKAHISSIIEVIRKKLSILNMKEIFVQPMGEKRILIQLPGKSKSDVEKIKALIERSGKLEFKAVVTDQGLLEEAAGFVKDGLTLPRRHFPYEYVYKKIANANGVLENDPTTAVLVETQAKVTGKDIKSASKYIDNQNLDGGYAVQVSFNGIGQSKFGDLTERIVRDPKLSRLAIILEDELNSSPSVTKPIYGNCEITGSFTADEAEGLVTVLKSGSMNAKLELISENNIGPSLGSNSIQSGIRACLIGGILVLLTMFIYYKKLGGVAIIALLINLLMLLGAMAAFGGTLTLPGIAGFALTIGMAVDATVLIYERLREESVKGEHIKASLTKGYARAFITIFDSNFTTFITALILYSIGNSGPVKGFCLSLMLGLMINLFAAVFVTQTILARAVVKGKLKDFGLKPFEKISQINFFDIGSKLRIGSYIIIAAGMFFLFTRGDGMYDVDFNGGHLVQISLDESASVNDVQEACKKAGFPQAVVQTFGQGNGSDYTIRTKIMDKETKANFEKVLRDSLPLKAGDAGFPRSVSVGGVAAKEMFAYALMALIAAMLVILFYIMVRFSEFKYGLAACVALVHDVLITLGFLAIFKFQINLTIFAAILTVIGYSLNDTIVIFDRIRENIGGQRNFDFKALAIKSLNQTLTRTIRTSITTFLVVSSLLFLGGGVIKGFAFTMLIGLITGTYSSLFIASPFVLYLHNREKKNPDTPSDENSQESTESTSPQTPATV